jgi:hypothetical protein
MKVNRFVTFLSAAACASLLATSATAGDHLTCYKVKDNAAGSPLKNKYTADLPSNIAAALDETGCTVATPAKLCCAPSDKVGIAPNPPPPDGAPRPAATEFCCYKAKCAKKPAVPNNLFSDQFGTRILGVSKVAYLCAPSSPSGAFVDSTELF